MDRVEADPTFARWMDAFLSSYYRRRPVNATFIGVHDWDHALPDYSEGGSGETLADLENLMNRSARIDVDGLTTSERIDLRLARGFLKTQIWEIGSSHFHRGNPSLYSGEAIFSVLSLFLTEFAPLEDRVSAATARMEAIGGLLAQARRNVTQAPPGWTEKALTECTGALAFLTEGVEALMAMGPIESKAFEAAAQHAAAAFGEFDSYLETELRYHTSDQYACGEEALSLYLTDGHFLDVDPDELVEYADSEIDEATAYLKEHAADFGANTPSDALAQLSDIHATTSEYYARYQELWDETRMLSNQNQLLTWPEFPIRYVPRPIWSREAAPHLYFLYYRSPAAFNRPPIHDYLVTPIDKALPPDEQERLLRATNDSVIKSNHVIHHGSIGHHVQNWHAFRAESRIGRIAAVDCATRIAMFCGGTMAEGWATYATDLINEFGGLSPLEAYAQRQSRARMCARAVVDIRLHQGRFSLDEGTEYYERRALMSPAAARSEAVKNSMFPGAAIMYLTGNDAIHDLRADMTQRKGSDFELGAFHDEFLSYGSIPVALISADMKAKADAAEAAHHESGRSGG